MSQYSALLLVLAAVLIADKCYASYIFQGDDENELQNPEYGEDTIDLQLLDNVGKRSSLIYSVTNDCIPQGSFCHYPYGPYYQCCENTGCFCNRLGFCTCKTYDATSENYNEDPVLTVANTNAIPE